MKSNNIGVAVLALLRPSAATTTHAPASGTGMLPGPNADYLFADGDQSAPLSASRYAQYVAPLLARRFPHLDPTSTKGDIDMAAGLLGTNIKASPFPKSFIDALWVTFYMQDEAAFAEIGPSTYLLSFLTQYLQDGASVSNLRRKSVDDISQASLVSLQRHFSAKVRRSLLHLTGQSLLGLGEIYAGTCDQPLPTCVMAPLLKHETSIHQHTAALDFNNRALRFLAAEGIDLKNITEGALLNVTDTICRLNEQHYNKGGRWLTYTPNALSEPRTKELLKAAIHHEMNAPRNVYSLFRSGAFDVDSVELGDKRLSLSFGSSALMGWFFDGFNGCALGASFRRMKRDFYALDVDVDKWRTNTDDLRKHVYITGIRGPAARVLSSGEFLHPRLLPPPADVKDVFGISLSYSRGSSYYAMMFVNSTDSEEGILAASHNHFDSMKRLIIRTRPPGL